MGLTKISGGVIQSDNFSVGVITATSLQIGSATTIHTTGIDLGSGNVTSHNINSTGIITAASFGAINGTTASFSGDVSIGGTLTYDDVTNIDSIGVVTARSGVHVTGVGASVGIGTDNPSHKLDVVGNTQLYGTLLIGDNTDISPTALGAGQLQIDTNGYTPYIAADGTAMHIGHNSSLRDLKLQTNETDRLTIDGSTGNIGIGTDNPQEKLHVLGTSDFVVDTDTSALRFGSYGEYDIALVTGRNTPANSSRVYIENGNGEALRIISNGNIGIGSTIPTQALDVAGRITKTEYEPGEIIERICSVCDGSTHVVKSGSYTMTDVTAAQSATTSDAVCSGSQISYTCPAGAKRIHYEYWFKWEAAERSGISNFFIEVDDADVVPSRRTFANNFSRYSTTYYHHGEGWYCMNWVFECDASSTDTSEGQYDSWASSEQTKVIRTKFREHSSTYEVILHSNYYWDGNTASGTNHDPIKPILIITTTA